MDLDHLQNIVRNLQYKVDKVKHVAEYCLHNNVNSEKQIAKILEKEFYGSIIDHKLATIFLINEIFIFSNRNNGNTFFKALSLKVKQFLEDVVKNVQDVKQMIELTRMLERWQSESMFSENFMDKLKKVMSPLYLRINEEIQNNHNDKFRKYKKTFLMEVMDLKYYTLTAKLYQHYQTYNDISNKLANFNQEYHKLDLHSQSMDTQVRAKQLLNATQDYEHKLIDVLCNLHKDFKMVRTECQTQLQKMNLQEK